MPDAETTLRNLLDDIIDKLNYKNPEIKINAITSNGANYTSVLYLATVSSSDKPELNLFAKVAIIGEKMREIMNGDTLFSTEQFVYTKLSKIYRSIEDKYDTSDRLLLPKFYGGNPTVGEETVVLDNLVAKGYICYNRFKSVDWDYASKAIEVLAKFHALSFAYQKEHPIEFEETVKNMGYKAAEETEAMLEAWMKIKNGALSLLEEGLRARVQEFLEQNASPVMFRRLCMPLKTPVLIHGDYRPSNLMYKKDLKKNTLDIIPVDFQTVHAGCPLNDLIYFITMGTDEEFRKLHYEALVEEYYRQLTLAMKRLHVDPEEAYPRDVFDWEYKQMLPYMVMVAVGILPIITVEAESAPKVDGDADMTEFVVKPNEIYASRFNGIINDCIRWGIIL